MEQDRTSPRFDDVVDPEHLVPIMERHVGTGRASEKARKRWSRGRWGFLLSQTQTGQPVSWGNMRQDYARICRRAQLGTFGTQPAKPEGQSGPAKQPPFRPLLKPYALRHTHATLSLQDGVALDVVSERLGHADQGFTLRTYVGKDRSRQRLAADAADGRMKALDTGTEG